MNNIKTLWRNSLGQDNLHDLMFIACDGPLPRECLPGLLISGWYLSGNGGLHLNGWKIPQCVDEN